MEQLKLQFPLKYWSVNQKFGKNDTAIYAQLGLKGHNGMDLWATDGTPVFAAHDGTVTFAGHDGTAGLGVVITTDKEFEYKGKPMYFKTIYWHLKEGSIKVTGSQKVKAGDLIALADNTGQSTGSHLHFGLKPVYQGETSWTWYNTDQNNGYNGAIDPQPYLPPAKEFSTRLFLGQSGLEVEKVQAFLVRNGFLIMPPNTNYGYYGNLTREAVYKFQQKYVDLTAAEKLLRGSTVGVKTLEALNKLNDSQ